MVAFTLIDVDRFGGRARTRRTVRDLLRQRLLGGSGAAFQRTWLWQLPADRFIRRLAQQTLAEGPTRGNRRGTAPSLFDATDGAA